MDQITAPGPYRLVSVDPSGGRLLVHTHQTAGEAWTELQDHLRIVNTVPNLRGWYAPDTGRRLIVTGPDHTTLPVLDPASFRGAKRAAASFLNNLGGGA